MFRLQLSPASVLPSGQSMFGPAGAGVGHSLGAQGSPGVMQLQVGQPFLSVAWPYGQLGSQPSAGQFGSGLHSQVAQPRPSSTWPYLQKMEHTGPQVTGPPSVLAGAPPAPPVLPPVPPLPPVAPPVPATLASETVPP